MVRLQQGGGAVGVGHQGRVGAAGRERHPHAQTGTPPPHPEAAGLDRVAAGGAICGYPGVCAGKISSNEKKPLLSTTSQSAARSSP